LLRKRRAGSSPVSGKKRKWTAGRAVFLDDIPAAGIVEHRSESSTRHEPFSLIREKRHRRFSLEDTMLEKSRCIREKTSTNAKSGPYLILRDRIEKNAFNMS
jgi:hypothetical protein